MLRIADMPHSYCSAAGVSASSRASARANAAPVIEERDLWRAASELQVSMRQAAASHLRVQHEVRAQHTLGIVRQAQRGHGITAGRSVRQRFSLHPALHCSKPPGRHCAVQSEPAQRSHAGGKHPTKCSWQNWPGFLRTPPATPQQRRQHACCRAASSGSNDSLGRWHYATSSNCNMSDRSAAAQSSSCAGRSDIMCRAIDQSREGLPPGAHVTPLHLPTARCVCMPARCLHW